MVTMVMLMVSRGKPVDLYCRTLDWWVLVGDLWELRCRTNPEPR